MSMSAPVGRSSDGITRPIGGASRGRAPSSGEADRTDGRARLRAAQPRPWLQTLTEDVLKSSEIEGEIFDRDQVRSSIARPPRHGYRRTFADGPRGGRGRGNDARRHPERRRATDGRAAVRLACRALPDGRSGMRRVKVGGWRDDRSGPMQVISGSIGRERVHFEAPAATRLEREMTAVPWIGSTARQASIRCSGGRRASVVRDYPPLR